MSSRTSDLEAARAAYDRRAWDTAYRSLQEADSREPIDTPDLWRLALSAYLSGRGDAFVSALERAHRAHLEAGEAGQAVRSAFWIWLHLSNRQEMGPATGWIARATRILEGQTTESVERGYLLLPRARQQLMSGDPEKAYGTAGEAAAFAERFGDRDLLALSVNLQGLARLGQARIGEGLALMDESMVAVATGELSPPVTGLIYCSVIGACRRVHALARAHEWTAALTSWCERQPELVAYAGECLVYRSELLRLRGDWGDAMQEARRAAERLESGLHPEAVSLALYQQGEGHRLVGELAAAEDAFRRASRLGREPQPGLALLRLAQGDVAAAAAAIRRVLGETRDRAQRARLLPAAVEILVEDDALDEAAAACDELDQIAQALGSGVLATQAAHACGAVELARGDAMAALASLRQACGGWQALEATYEVARVRALIGRACRAIGDEDAAALELEAARAGLERLGAASDLARLDAMRKGARAPDDHGLTPRELEVLALVATGRTNRAIATELSISERTVARHVANIFLKLGLSSRSAATAYAYEHGLVQPST